MSNLVATNIRLPAEDLKKYRMIALEEGKSFSGLVREILKLATESGYIKPFRKNKKA